MTGTAAKRPTIPASSKSSRQDDEHERGIGLDRPPVDHGADEIAQDRATDAHQREHRDGAAPVPCAARVIDRMISGRDDAAEVRDVPAEEGQHRKRQCERHAQDHHEHVVGGRDERREDGRPTQVAADPCERGVTGRRDQVALLVADRLEHPEPRLVTVAQEEEHEEGARIATVTAPAAAVTMPPPVSPTLRRGPPPEGIARERATHGWDLEFSEPRLQLVEACRPPTTRSSSATKGRNANASSNRTPATTRSAEAQTIPAAAVLERPWSRRRGRTEQGLRRR